GELAVEEDSEFHYRIALASGNSVVLKVMDVVMDLLRETRSRSLQSEGRPQKSLAGHKRILSAIKRRDPEAAEAAMRQHIGDEELMVFDTLKSTEGFPHGPFICLRNYLPGHLSEDPGKEHQPRYRAGGAKGRQAGHLLRALWR